MTVRKLSHLSLDEILEAFYLAFENYFVKMPTERAYYEARWKAAKVDFSLSYGMFDNNKLVGFIIHAIDNRAGRPTAFNTGTGVIPKYRRRKITKAIYDYALKDLYQNEILHSTLEVITQNDYAVRAYKGVGFRIIKNFECYAGKINMENTEQYDLREISSREFRWSTLPNQEYYSWDFQKETIIEGSYKYYQVWKNGILDSYFIINPSNSYIGQCDVLNNEDKSWERLFSAIKQVSEKVKIINVDDRLKDKLNIIERAGLENTVNQYEMELDIAKSVR